MNTDHVGKTEQTTTLKVNREEKKWWRGLNSSLGDGLHLILSSRHEVIEDRVEGWGL